MSKMKNALITLLIAAVVSLGSIGCSDKDEHPTNGDHPASEETAKKAASEEHPTDKEHPSKETTGGETASKEHPAGEHPTK